MKIACIVGARPQFIKLAPLSRELKKRHRQIIIHTGQHYDPELSEIFFKELRLPRPDYNLKVGSGGHSAQTGEMLIRLEKVLLKEKPDWVIIFGDTNSTLAGALAAAKLHIPLAHVEAGMRSFNNSMPEEANRKVADHLSQLLFCPTKTAVKNLRNEGIRKGVYLVGDLMQEALFENIRIAAKKSGILKRLRLSPRKYNLLTIHRAENTESKRRLSELVNYAAGLKLKTVFPVHPRTEKYLKKFGLWGRLLKAPNLIIMKPVGYLDMLILIKNATRVLTDSGGVQREAYFLGRPCLVMRTETEWVEMVGRGNVLFDKKGCNAPLNLALALGKKFAPMKKLTSIRIRQLISPNHGFGKE
ncbi:MAG: UDP-N-acetylglucosamine 2-epimerase (non-hydrolyzing) [candidate division Zixibacteria bacterium]|nr:UDP-N-acetylglucosamine 2-epimerase (non-hydrolyzing) [candidate division Zixibacteria bacterium]